MTLDLSFKELVDVAANPCDLTGRPLLVAIGCIDEDPDQPRRTFGEQELEELSQSIAEHGVLQPIVLRPSTEDGRFVIAMGARRYRAAQHAGLLEMPAFIQDVALPDRYAQMIENIQRDDLRAQEIARFIADRLDAGDTQAEISRKLGKPRDWVSRYASVQAMPDFLRARLEGSSIRALYELYQVWRTHPDEIEQRCATQDSFTDAQARQLARDVRGEGGRTNRRNELPVGRPRSENSDPLPEAVLPRNAVNDREAATEGHPKTRVVSQSKPAASLAIRVRYQDRTGQLVIDRLATQGSRHAVVLVDGADHEEEVPASALTIVEILSR
ncbi:ParB/RepB/Spo0J family partition protein [Bradyrhizobium sp. INPA01-394B]|uniref:ParB/RepB/Spo0J family partition protein n=1 Tax=Bradyrhizobium campsiandrae TaxID=1729892 RepID=A0ABR7UIW7_9BRAD|nr:ParB/RepB/Spo0J family partition protein [Bradyrhizobium campsiandrae]MBC9883080.1 ParB/RepB/Spo0J family partition protein [Bradyrhizobium campsiandrae]MBC9983551.1 ParB/RepB/Spo0J family partition protein [Bradyrhizobium campsiandrae]